MRAPPFRLLCTTMLLLASLTTGALAQSDADIFPDLALPTDGATDGVPAAAPAPFLTPAPPSGFGLAPGIGTPSGEPRLNYSGTASVAYGEKALGPFDATPLGCGLGYLSPLFRTHFVGVSPDIFQDGYACGRCIKLQCDDASCSQPGYEQPALVADLCGSCTGLDMSIAGPLFRNLTGRDPGSNPSLVVSWELTPCSFTEGTIKMLVKEGGVAYFQAFGFSNYAVPIVAVQVNGETLVRGTDNNWQWNPGKPIDPSAPLEVLIAGSTREVLRARVPTLRSADLGVQFRPQ